MRPLPPLLTHLTLGPFALGTLAPLAFPSDLALPVLVPASGPLHWLLLLLPPDLHRTASLTIQVSGKCHLLREAFSEYPWPCAHHQPLFAPITLFYLIYSTYDYLYFFFTLDKYRE